MSVGVSTCLHVKGHIFNMKKTTVKKLKLRETRLETVVPS